jgi:hypothetical protein
VGVAKRRTLAALDLRPEYAQWLTTDDKDARMQARRQTHVPGVGTTPWSVWEGDLQAVHMLARSAQPAALVHGLTACQAAAF